MELKCERLSRQFRDKKAVDQVSFTIDKGSEDGIREDMNVLSGSGLVGIVTEVNIQFSDLSVIGHFA